jgi:hypothetical protein
MNALSHTTSYYETPANEPRSVVMTAVTFRNQTGFKFNDNSNPTTVHQFEHGD